ncbi:MAG: beta-galactosidase, partial [Chloroflexales bacterium]|nr:beta-galactosidase [Chloroflexales bacterium]
MAPAVTVDRDGLHLDGRPFYLLAGCVHYFRWPRAEWRPLLEQARWGGLNTIDTVIPWNRHELSPGVFDFADEADLAAYLDLCHELGLKAIVRPGPYICAEWENGGLPAWLTAEPGLALRTDDERYMAAAERWFDTLMPIIAPRQHTRGGPVVLCQIENEHWASGVYAHDEHQRSLAAAAIARGIDVPQYTCMGATPEWPELRNGWSGIAEKLVQTRALWRDNPMIVSELWSGWFDSWGASRQTRKAAAKLDVTLHQLTAVGCAGFSHWMWAGGTNFGFWGGRTVGGDTVHMAASYDYDAPVSEYGEARAKALIARRHHLFLG